jgi:hypothetical protein
MVMDNFLTTEHWLFALRAAEERVDSWLAGENLADAGYPGPGALLALIQGFLDDDRLPGSVREPWDARRRRALERCQAWYEGVQAFGAAWQESCSQGNPRKVENLEAVQVLLEAYAPRSDDAFLAWFRAGWWSARAAFLCLGPLSRAGEHEEGG